ncbi:MAG: ChbG/HpnK family deacetylase [Leptospiraceae bacterium]|nr:ChbG/HpnK family deacetylase [Leptospiraceae bacterium]
MIKLIVSGDDFGLHSSINEAIEDSFQNGILTSASVVVTGEAIEEAVKIAERNPNLGIGLHITLIEEKSLTIAPNLAPEGRFPENHNRLAKDILLKKIPSIELENEIEAQILYAKKHFKNLTHIDSHRHLHMLPGIYSVVRRLMKKHELNKMRYVRVPFFDYRKDQLFKNILSLVFHLLGFIRIGIETPDYFWGFMESGNMNERKLMNLIEKLSEGVWEIGLHPGKSNHSLKEKYPLWDNYYTYQFSWEDEWKALMSDKISALIKNKNIELVNFQKVVQ